MKKANMIKKMILTAAAAGILFVSASSVFAANANFKNVPTNNTMNIGQTVTIGIRNAKTTDIRWMVEGDALELISTNGAEATLKAVKVGEAEVLADNKLLSIDVQKISVTGVKLSHTSTNININKKMTLTATALPANATVTGKTSWKSSNTAVATVANGVVTAKAPGTAKITATIDGKSSTCTVNVKSPLTKVTLNKTSATLNSDSTLKLSVSLTPANTTDNKTVTWSTSNSAIATVKNGTVTAIKAGTATITAKVAGKSASCKITVKAAGKFVNVTECYNTLNSYRKAKGLKALAKNATLEKHAQTRAKELVKKFSHTRPNGQKGLAIIQGNLYKGENIAMGQKTCAQVMKDWYGSKGHRDNMIGGTACSKNFTKVGIACWKYNGTCYWVQLFSN